MKQTILLFSLLISLYTYGQDITKGLVAYYPLNGNAKDMSGNGLDGKMFGTIPTVDFKGNKDNALLFNGVDNYISIPSKALNSLRKGTISFWINLADNKNGTVISKQHDGINSISVIGVGYIPSEQNSTTPGRIAYHISNNSSTNGIIYQIDNNKFYHIVISFSATKMIFYVNGVATNTFYGNYIIPYDENPTHTTIGAWLGGGGGKYLKGKLDEIRIYNRELNDSEVKILYNIHPKSEYNTSQQNTQQEINTNPQPAKPKDEQIVNGQIVYNEPLFEKSIKSFTKINKIEVDNEKTLVYYDVINSNPISEDDSYYTREIRTIHFYMQGEKGQEAFALQDAESKKVYKQIKSKASNMPRGVDKKNYDLVGQQRKSFVMAFEKIDSNTKVINLFHGSDYNWGKTSGDYWFIYGIKLMSENEKTNYIAEKNEEEKNRQEAYAASQEKYKKEQAENERREIERRALIKSQIENRTFTGSHFYEYGNFKYTGSFINGVPNGQGKWEKPDGSWYEGNFKDGVEHGRGTLRQNGGLRYTGNFTNGYPNGTFKIERWTLMGLAKDTWTAEYKDGNLVSSSQTETGMTDFLNSKPTTSSSSTKQENSSTKTMKETPTVKKIEFEQTKSSFVMGESEKYYVTYSDGTTGYLFYSKKYSQWYINDGATDFGYDSKDNALSALYEYKDNKTIRKIGRQK